MDFTNCPQEPVDWDTYIHPDLFNDLIYHDSCERLELDNNISHTANHGTQISMNPHVEYLDLSTTVCPDRFLPAQPCLPHNHGNINPSNHPHDFLGDLVDLAGEDISQSEQFTACTYDGHLLDQYCTQRSWEPLLDSTLITNADIDTALGLDDNHKLKCPPDYSRISDADNLSHSQVILPTTETVPDTRTTTNGIDTASPLPGSSPACAQPQPTTKRRRVSRTPSKPTKRRKAQRTKIPPSAKEVMEKEFVRNQYPSVDDLALLATATQLNIKIIRTWFSNARSRNEIPGDLVSDMITMNSPNFSRVESVSSAKLECLNRLSPPTGRSSLERYLAAPASDDPVPSATIQAAIQETSVQEKYGSKIGMTKSTEQYSPSHTCDVSDIDSDSLYEILVRLRDMQYQAQLPQESAVSTNDKVEIQGNVIETEIATNSESSRGSDKSAHSSASNRSIDSRGSRRGRKRWPDLQSLPTNTAYQFTCTWPTCSLSFRYQSEWKRHEESVHYSPYHWVCGLESAETHNISDTAIRNENSCAGKDLNLRTFLRKDQFAAHMRRVHPEVGEWVTSRLLLSWKIKNTSPECSAVHCGFCGTSFDSWDQRQNHVAIHLRKGSCKTGWWPTRLPLVVIPELHSDEYETCPLRHHDPKHNLKIALSYFEDYVSWSCRYISCPHSIFIFLDYSVSRCLICGTHVSGYNMETHAEKHKLQSCKQEIFTDANAFLDHVVHEHGARTSSVFGLGLWSHARWKAVA
ncbi:hypothetical protein P153DRAFT_396509 [Dothidotthia symphoricarpi CBS 119687]|uniref:Homeobox domain-containing protein n=1 Tax=Dothidotthia symphoricarpi CBS 119687 TaxID=1392245 RepID=A0A6A6AB95_9PLEO|nr:uncharacterized protein P153DRAFT_396509 [Dothidotthia symphoricarpi CBS 119687]KAF2129212.1 hypothetical protein P153DRAFT_396509 [Dothidotthia symphoricarpi CBS 119687]